MIIKQRKCVINSSYPAGGYIHIYGGTFTRTTPSINDERSIIYITSRKYLFFCYITYKEKNMNAPVLIYDFIDTA